MEKAMARLSRILIMFAALLGLLGPVAAAPVNLAPPDSGLRNSITFNGRTYSSTPGIAIPVPDFDAPTLQANGWIVATPAASASASPFDALRRVARDPSINGPTLMPRLVGAQPWAASTAFSTGAVVSKGGLAYVARAGGTSGASWTNDRTAGGAGQVDGSVTWDYIGAQTAPQLTSINTGTHDAALTNIITMTSIGTLPAGQGPIRWRGGKLEQQGVANYWGMTGPTVASGATFTATRNQIVGGIEFILEGTKVEIGTFANARTFNVIVDGRNLDFSPSSTSGGATKYFTIDFTNVATTNDMAAATGRSRHHIVVETWGNTGILQVATEPTGTISYPPQSEEWSIGVIVDSQGAGVISGSFTTSVSAWPQQLVKMLNIPDICNLSIGGTGFVTAGTQWPYGSHAMTDLATCNTYRSLKYIIVQSSTNDNGQTAGAITAAAASLFSAIRATYPNVPIIVTGVVAGPATGLTNSQNIENAVFAGTSGISQIYTIPVSTASTPWFSGTGKEGAANGTGNTDYNILNDGTHLSQPGHTYFARRVAAAILSIVAAKY
jgi:lysophospholipase L1-like esterase